MRRKSSTRSSLSNEPPKPLSLKALYIAGKRSCGTERARSCGGAPNARACPRSVAQGGSLLETRNTGRHRARPNARAWNEPWQSLGARLERSPSADFGEDPCNQHNALHRGRICHRWPLAAAGEAESNRRAREALWRRGSPRAATQDLLDMGRDKEPPATARVDPPEFNPPSRHRGEPPGLPS